MILQRKLPSENELQANGQYKKIQYSIFECDFCNNHVKKVHNAGLNASTCGSIECTRKYKVEQANLKFPNSPMLRIKDLGIIESKLGKFMHMGIYECPTCKDHITISFNAGKTQKSCSKIACVKANTIRKRSYTTQITHGMSNTKLYHVWRAMLVRTNPNNSDVYKHRNYAGKGVETCAKWKTFEGFYEDMGKGYEEFKGKLPSIDRIDSNGNYELSNCQWLEHSDNSSKDRKIPVVQMTLDGEYIAKFDSAYDAAKLAQTVDSKTIIPGKINAVCLGKRKSHAGFTWCKEIDYNPSSISGVQVPIIISKPQLRVVQLTTNMEYISTFDSYEEAGRFLGASTKTCSKIKEVCAGNRNTYNGFSWMYESDWDTKIKDSSKEFILWDTEIREDCSAKWKLYETFRQDVGLVSVGNKIIKDNSNRPWSKSNIKIVPSNYIRIDNSARIVVQTTKGDLTKEVARFNTSVEAGQVTGITNANIRAVCTGKRKSAGGFSWKYVD